MARQVLHCLYIYTGTKTALIPSPAPPIWLRAANSRDEEDYQRTRIFGGFTK